MRIAIIGTGISGLVAAHLLQAGHEITLFEANDYVGGHTNTIDVNHRGQTRRIDTGFIVFNERNYPLFTRLLDQLNVASQPTSMSFSVHCQRTGLEYNGSSLNQLFIQRRNLFRPSFHRMLRDIVRFNRTAVEMLGSQDDDTTVADYAASRGYSQAFLEQYLVPLGAALWSAPAASFRTFPIRFVVAFLHNHAMLQWGNRPVWRVIRGGSQTYVRALIKPFAERIELNTPVVNVSREASCVRLRTADASRREFDHVIFACHADQALAMLADAKPVERELLGSFPYQKNLAILHTDTAMLPHHRKAWASWNYRIPRQATDHVTVTYNMNMLQSLEHEETYCVTLNAEHEIDAEKVLRRITYHHPVFTAGRIRAQQRHQELIDVNRSSFCGAYWGYGFHEDGVCSAAAVARALGGEAI